MEEPTLLGRADGRDGEVLLRRREGAHGPVHELVVNGVFAMDSTETTSERELARFARMSDGRAPRVLVGGLGLGYTAAEVLADPAVGATLVDVVELEPHLVEWARAGLTPELDRVAQDPRSRLHVADVTTVLQGAAGPAGPWDAILLDVDNGPDFLIHGTNADLYTRETLEAAYGRLSEGGVLALWCQGPAPLLLDTLRAIAPSTGEHHYIVQRGHRTLGYAIYILTRKTTPTEASSPEAAG